MRYQYANDSQLYISGELSDDMIALSQCLEAVEIWMENISLKSESYKAGVALGVGLFGS